MKRDSMTYRTAIIFSFGITLMIHLFFMIMFFFGRDAVLPPPDAPERPRPELDIYHLIFSFANNLIFIFILFVTNFKVLKSDIKHKTLAFLTANLILVIGFSTIWWFLQLAIFPNDKGPHWMMFLGRLIGELFLCLIVGFISEIMYLSLKQQNTELKNKELVSENTKSRYEALKSQIDPHFLFNTFSALSSIIEVDPTTAQAYVQELSSVFRYTLQNKEIVTLEDELKFTKNYCNLMRIRYGEHLTFDFRIEDRYLGYYLVPLSVQSLVENAIKHNVISIKNPLPITIETSDDSLTVSNPLKKKAVPESGEGIGLANLAERYRLKWNREIMVQSKDNIFRVTIPLITPSLNKK